jgi:hypothetical protein
MGFSLKHRAGSFMVVAIFLLGKCLVFLEFFNSFFFVFVFVFVYIDCVWMVRK